MRIKFTHTYDNIISLENLLEAWKEFRVGKRKRKDVQEFERNLMANIILLHHDLVIKIYRHGDYEAFKIFDPKSRDIHKATVRDRLLHHAIYRTLYPFFDRTFISDSYSCRIGKGSHKPLNRFRLFVYQASCDNTRTVWVLKCDIKRFFASVNQKILLEILGEYIPNPEVMWLLRQIVGSFNSGALGIGLPLGNLTSQLFVNIYMNRFDQFMKHCMKVTRYIRYADDFVVVSSDKSWLEELLPKIGDFLSEELGLNLHPNKVSIRTIVSGEDFLGWVHFPSHRVLRNTTKKRMFKRIKERENHEATIQSYLGLLGHGNTYKLAEKIREKYPIEQSQN